MLNCRQCKRGLVTFLSDYFLNNISTYLQDHQTLYVAGGFDGHLTDTVWYVQGNSRPQPDPTYTSNAEETDTRIWLHVKQTAHKQILLLSPDTDVYHIGLPLEHHKQVIVQTSPMNSREMQFLDMLALIKAFQNDPDLATIDTTILPQVMQTLFVSTGCDYTSFFCQIGKAIFFCYFFQYAPFITGKDHQGTLADTSLEGESYNTGFLAFLCLIGTVYYKKHATGFETPSPANHFLKFSGAHTTTQQQHKTWLEDIRQTVADRSTFDTEMIPSIEALYYHWKRSCWVIHMWRQGDKNQIVLKPLTDYGWTLSDNKLAVLWDTPENLETIRQRVHLLLKGCKCVTGCTTRRCSCKKKNTQCFEGCQCTNCLNMPITEGREDTDLVEIALEEEVTTDSTQLDTDELLDWVFGAENEDNMSMSDTTSVEDDASELGISDMENS